MEKLLNAKVLDHKTLNQANYDDDVLVAISESEMEFEGKIGNGNLQDYLEIYGELD